MPIWNNPPVIEEWIIAVVPHHLIASRSLIVDEEWQQIYSSTSIKLISHWTGYSKRTYKHNDSQRNEYIIAYVLRDTYLKCYTVSQQSRTSFLPNLRRSFVSYHIIGKNYYYIFDAGDFSFLNASSRCYSCTTGIKKRKNSSINNIVEKNAYLK